MASEPLRLGLVGRHIAHSRSPQMHTATLARLQVSGTYQLFECVGQGEAAALFEQVKRGELSGLNVTTPFKGLAANVADVRYECDASGRLTPSPSLRSVNTLWRDELGRLCATSTDGPGLGLGLRRHGLWFPDGPGAVIGAGGAGQAVLRWLSSLGVEVGWVCNRDVHRARSVVTRLQLTAQALSWSQSAQMAEAAWVIHATRLGHGAASDASPLGSLPWGAWAARRSLVIDLVYGLEATAAQRLALEALNPSVCEGGGVWLGSGEAMLAGQAALSMRVWTGGSLPFDEMQEALTVTN